MSEDPDGFIRRHLRSGLLIDTNLLLVLLVGYCDPSLIPQSNRTREYHQQDYELLTWMVTPFAGNLVTTPSVLSEVSNLADNALYGDQKKKLFRHLESHVLIVDERYVRSASLVSRSEFHRLGLTDSGIIASASIGVGVLTDDLKLYIELVSRGLSAINYNHYREDHL